MIICVDVVGFILLEHSRLLERPRDQNDFLLERGWMLNNFFTFYTIAIYTNSRSESALLLVLWS